jgi:hypothetical protein
VAAALAVILAGVLVMAWLLSSHDQPSRTTDTRSDTLPTPAARVEFLARYLKLRAPVTDAAFHVVWHDNSGGGVPGPSDGSIVAALRVSPADAKAWLADARPATAAAPAPARSLIPATWNVTSAGDPYVRDGTSLRWHHEGVLEVAAGSH